MSRRPTGLVYCTSAIYDFCGQSKTLTDWARSTGLSPCTINRRLERGWSLERALTTRCRQYRRRAAD